MSSEARRAKEENRAILTDWSIYTYRPDSRHYPRIYLAWLGPSAVAPSSTRAKEEGPAYVGCPYRQRSRCKGLEDGARILHYRDMNITEIREVAVPACRDFRVKRLDLFGSAAREETSDASDVDLLVEFQRPDDHLAKRFFGLLHRLEDSLNCEVDLLTVDGLRNPYFRERVMKERVQLYEE